MQNSGSFGILILEGGDRGDEYQRRQEQRWRVVPCQKEVQKTQMYFNSLLLSCFKFSPIALFLCPITVIIRIQLLFLTVNIYWVIQFKCLIELLDCALLGNPVGSYMDFFCRNSASIFYMFFQKLVCWCLN